MGKQIIVDTKAKLEWTRPEVCVIEAGSAESGDLNVADGGGPGQSS